MPCRSDYMEQKDYEKEIQNTAKLALSLMKRGGIKFEGKLMPKQIREISKDMYPSKTDGDIVVAILCLAIRNLKETDEAKFEELVYGRNPEARQLANWWEEHEKADNLRINLDAERREKEWDKFSEELLVGDSEMDAHLDYFIKVLVERGYEVPVKSKEIEE